MEETNFAQAEKELGKIGIASLGALEKSDGSFRVIHDATHGLAVNAKIKVLDQVLSPTAIDSPCSTSASKGILCTEG